MPRIRTIKPAFFTDEKVSPMDPIDRLVFLGLVSMADDAGRLLDQMRSIDGFIFPYRDDLSAAPSVSRLAGAGRIIRYTTEAGQKLIQIRYWNRHQRIEKASSQVLPPPAVEDVEAVALTTIPGTIPESNPDELGSRSGTIPGGIAEPFPDESPPGSRKKEVGDGKKEEGTPLRGGRGRASRSGVDDGEIDPVFERAWLAYPKRRPSSNRLMGERAWRATVKRGGERDDMLRAVQAYAAVMQEQGKVGTDKVKMFATFFGPAEPWRDALRDAEEGDGGIDVDRIVFEL